MIKDDTRQSQSEPFRAENNQHQQGELQLEETFGKDSQRVEGPEEGSTSEEKKSTPKQQRMLWPVEWKFPVACEYF